LRKGACMTTVHLDLADEHLRAAQEGGYHHPPGFAGFSATVAIQAGGETATGTVTIGPDAEPQLDLAGSEDARAWAGRELASMAAHRRHRTYEEGDGRHGKRLGPADEHPLGRRVELDDPLSSSFRVRDGQLTEITRSHGNRRFTIVIQDRVAAPDGRSVSTSFTVSYWDTDTGRLTRADTYADGYVERDGLLLPAFRQVATSDDDGLTVRRLELSDHRLLAESGS
jgi:hypothetical protein